MGLFRRLFSIEYRRAVTAEAGGDYITAAKSYALCGERAKVAEMHLAQVGHENSLDGRLHTLYAALGFTKPDSALSTRVLKRLGENLVQQAHDLGLSSTDGRRVMGEAARRLEEAKTAPPPATPRPASWRRWSRSCRRKRSNAADADMRRTRSKTTR